MLEALHSGLQLCDCIACLALWLSQRTFLITVNSSKPCGKAARLQLHVCGNGYRSIVLVVSRLFFLTVLASSQNPLVSNSLVPARPVKKTRSGHTVKAMEKVMGAV